MAAEFTSTDFAATLKSTRLREGLSKSILMWPSNDLNSPAVLGQPIASTQKRTCVWDGSIFQDDRACAATVAAINASPSNARPKLAALRMTMQLLRRGMKNPRRFNAFQLRARFTLSQARLPAAAVHARPPLARKQGLRPNRLMKCGTGDLLYFSNQGSCISASPANRQFHRSA